MKITPKQYATALLESLSENPGQEKKVAARFAEALINNGQTSRLEEILEIFESLWNKQKNLVKAEIISYTSLGKEIVKSLQELISKNSQADKIEISEKLDKQILGGVVLRYGDRVLDLSLKNKLGKLKEELIN